MTRYDQSILMIIICLILRTGSASADNVTPDVVTYIDSTTAHPQTQPQSSMTNTSDLTAAPAQQQLQPQPSLAQPFGPMQENGIDYITGGIGDEERNALDNVKSQYNLHVTSSSTSGAFLGNVYITISNGQGHSLITVPAGPVFYASLADGRYIVEARSEDQTKQQVVRIGAHKPVNLHFSWQ